MNQTVRSILLLSTLSPLFSAACSTSPTGPSGVANTGAAAATDLSATGPSGSSETGGSSGAVAVTAATGQACTPSFVRGKVANNFFLLTVKVPAGCEWFAVNRESTGNYWELTAPDYALRNQQKYPNGVTGISTQKIGVHFIRKVGWADHRQFVLDVCAGTSCSGGAIRTYRYTIR